MTSNRNSDTKHSTFIVTCRLLPSTSFKQLKSEIRIGDGYTVQIKDDLAWITFEANADTWEAKRNEGLQYLRNILSAATLQVEYPFDFEPIQWIEDKPRIKPESKAYVLGRLGARDFIVQRQPPHVTEENLHKARSYLLISEASPYFRMAMVDYSIALSIPREAIVFCARSVEWLETYFKDFKRRKGLPGNQKIRDIMRRELCAPRGIITKFFKIANETTISRHSGDFNQVRAPVIGEIRFCIYLCRILLDRFSLYLWHENQKLLQSVLPFPEDSDLKSLLSEKNEEWQHDLNILLSGENG